MVCDERKSMVVSDKAIQAEGLGDFFKSLVKKWFNVSKKLAKNVFSILSRALDFAANIATAAASKNAENVMSTLPELITFYKTGKGLYLSKFV